MLSKHCGNGYFGFHFLSPCATLPPVPWPAVALFDAGLTVTGVDPAGLAEVVAGLAGAGFDPGDGIVLVTAAVPTGFAAAEVPVPAAAAIFPAAGLEVLGGGAAGAIAASGLVEDEGCCCGLSVTSAVKL